MITSLIEISLVGLITGFIFSVPVTGPIGILTISKTLQGQRSYAVMAATGAAVVDILYCFIAVFGFVKFVKAYEDVIPYILAVGSVVIVVIAVRIYRTKLDMEHIDETRISHRQPRISKRGALMTGFMINFLNPTLFFGWLASSFIAMSFVASIGLDFAGFQLIVDKSYKSTNVKRIKEENKESSKNITESVSRVKSSVNEASANVEKPEETAVLSNGSKEFTHSLVFAFFLGIGTIVWFYLFTGVISKYRKKMKITTVNKVIQILGIILILFGVYIALKACEWFDWFAWKDLFSWIFR
ncbi:MAG: LysE family translocator [Planctomycetes bacterium]|nr:LysE family translocator [Planctomycetota bacterium]